MKPFQFRLQRVLDTRCHEEEEAQQTFITSGKQLAKEEATLHSLLRTQAWIYNNRRQKRNGVTPASDELADIQYREALSKHVALQHGRVVQAQQQVDHARQALQEIMQKRKAMERLKEDDYATFQKTLLHIEQQTMDELAARSANRIDA